MKSFLSICLSVIGALCVTTVGNSQTCSIVVSSDCTAITDLCIQHYGNHACTPSLIDPGIYWCEDIEEETKPASVQKDGIAVAPIGQPGFRQFTQTTPVYCQLVRPCDAQCEPIETGGVVRQHCKPEAGAAWANYTGWWNWTLTPGVSCIGGS